MFIEHSGLFTFAKLGNQVEQPSSLRGTFIPSSS